MRDVADTEKQSEEGMEISKLKLEIYDFLGIIIPGLMLLAESLILVQGWPLFIESMNRINGIELTLLILFSFGIGNIVQEFGDVTMKLLNGKRYARVPRDNFWHSNEARLVKSAIKKESDLDIEVVDTAFDYCLTRIKDRFPKRDLFVAVSDMCRSLLVLSLLAILPVARIAFFGQQPLRCPLPTFLGLTSLLAVVGALAWMRMSRFRVLSEVTVFHVYLATSGEKGDRASASQTAKETESGE
jgi:hypothetical protein